MDEEVITWNLKGPKRMRKRRELNALIKNNLKYKPFLRNNSSASADLKVGNRLLKNPNDTTSDENDDYYFAANKLVLRNKNRKNYCKILQMIILGFIITFGFLTGTILLFSYSKFNDTITDLKKEIKSQNEQSIKQLDDLKRQVNEYDSFFKKLNALEGRVHLLELNYTAQPSKRLERSKRSQKLTLFDEDADDSSRSLDLIQQSLKSVQSDNQHINSSINNIYLSNRLNVHMIEWILKYLSKMELERADDSKLSSAQSAEGGKRHNLLRNMFNKYYDQDTKDTVLTSTDLPKIVRKFLQINERISKLNDKQTLKIDDESTLVELFSDFHSFVRADLLNEVNVTLIKPIIEQLEKSKCP